RLQTLNRSLSINNRSGMAGIFEASDGKYVVRLAHEYFGRYARLDDAMQVRTRVLHDAIDEEEALVKRMLAEHQATPRPRPSKRVIKKLAAPAKKSHVIGAWDED